MAHLLSRLRQLPLRLRSVSRIAVSPARSPTMYASDQPILISPTIGVKREVLALAQLFIVPNNQYFSSAPSVLPKLEEFSAMSKDKQLEMVNLFARELALNEGLSAEAQGNVRSFYERSFESGAFATGGHGFLVDSLRCSSFIAGINVELGSIEDGDVMKMCALLNKTVTNATAEDLSKTLAIVDDQKAQNRYQVLLGELILFQLERHVDLHNTPVVTSFPGTQFKDAFRAYCSWNHSFSKHIHDTLLRLSWAVSTNIEVVSPALYSLFAPFSKAELIARCLAVDCFSEKEKAVIARKLHYLPEDDALKHLIDTQHGLVVHNVCIKAIQPLFDMILMVISVNNRSTRGFGRLSRNEMEARLLDEGIYKYSDTYSACGVYSFLRQHPDIFHLLNFFNINCVLDNMVRSLMDGAAHHVSGTFGAFRMVQDFDFCHSVLGEGSKLWQIWVTPPPLQDLSVSNMSIGRVTDDYLAFLRLGSIGNTCLNISKFRKELVGLPGIVLSGRCQLIVAYEGDDKKPVARSVIHIVTDGQGKGYLMMEQIYGPKADILSTEMTQYVAELGAQIGLPAICESLDAPQLNRVRHHLFYGKSRHIIHSDSFKAGACRRGQFFKTQLLLPKDS